MENKPIVCSSCKTPITNLKGSTRFNCPNCAKEEIIRCEKCRRAGTKYRCSQCGFEGPN